MSRIFYELIGAKPLLKFREILFFLLGTLAYKTYRRVRSQTQPNYVLSLIFCVVILSTLIYGFLPAEKLVSLPFSYREMAYFLLVVMAIPYLFIFSKNNRLDMSVGELSYPIYISHMFIILFVHRALPPTFNNGWFIALATILFSLLLNRFVADPIEKIRQRRVAEPAVI